MKTTTRAMVRISASQDGAPLFMNQVRRGDMVMASTKARSTGDRISLAIRMANKTMAAPANKTTELIRGGEDVSEFMIDLL
jgi:hypothetical protein